jgi:beta-galactosidase
MLPGPLAPAVGAHYLESTGLVDPVPVLPAGRSALAIENGRGTAWADGLIVDGASALATYDHPHLRRWPAITTQEHGSGRVTYVGTLPDATLARSFAVWIAKTSLLDDPWRMTGGSVTSSGARAADGRRLRFLANWSWETSTITLPSACADVLSEERLELGATVSLASWDVRVLVEAT